MRGRKDPSGLAYLIEEVSSSVFFSMMTGFNGRCAAGFTFLRSRRLLSPYILLDGAQSFYQRHLAGDSSPHFAICLPFITFISCHLLQY